MKAEYSIYGGFEGISPLVLKCKLRREIVVLANAESNLYGFEGVISPCIEVTK